MCNSLEERDTDLARRCLRWGLRCSHRSVQDSWCSGRSRMIQRLLALKSGMPRL